MTSINPGLRLVRRDAQSLQIGVGAGGIILGGLQPNEINFVFALGDGIPDGRVAERATQMGVDPPRAQEICTLLARVLFPDTDVHATGFRNEQLRPERAAALGLYQGLGMESLQQRWHSVIQLTGLGRTGAVIAASLASSGVGTLLLEDDSPVTASDVGPGSFRVDDIGISRALAVRRNVQRIDPACQAHVMHSVVAPDGGVIEGADGGGLAFGSRRGGLNPGGIDLAIVVAHDAVPYTTAARFLVAEKPHLFVLIREQDATVGPLVVPGETACSECVERHRSEHDPQWLNICEQLSAPGQPASSQRVRTEGLALSMAVAGTAATHALLLLDGVNRPSSWSAVLTFHPNNGQWSREEFETHPRCGCQWQSQSLATIANTASP